MDTMTLYVDKKSPIHSIDPLTKLIYAIANIAVAYIFNRLVSIFILTLLTFFVLLLGKVFRRILPILGLSLLLIFSIVIVQGFFNPENQTKLFEIGGIIFYKEGILVASMFTLRILNMIASFGVLILTTRPDELVEALIRRGFSPRFGYVILAVLQLIPQMQATMGKITDAQRSRGMETEGNLIIRIQAFFPLIIPVVLNSLNDTRERAIALEIRGFASKSARTFLNEKEKYPYTNILRGFIFAVLIGVVVWRVWR